MHMYQIYTISKHKSTKSKFHTLLCITNNSIKHQSFVYTQLNDRTVLFLTYQVSLIYLFALSLNVNQFYLTHLVLLLRARVNLGVMGIEGYSAFPKAPEFLMSHHHIV